MSKRLGIPYVTPYRNGGWRYRRLVPRELRENLGRSNWTRAWPAGTDLEVVAREAKRLAALHDVEIAKARGDADAAAEATAKALHRGAKTPDDIAWGIQFFTDAGQHRLAEALAGGGTLPKKTMTVSKALAQDRKLYSGDRDPRAIHYAVESFKAACDDLDVLAITRADVSLWLAQQRDAGYAPGTIRRRYGALKALVDRTARDLGSEKRSPFEHRIGGKSKVTDRLPLNRAMLDAMLAYLDRGRCGFETGAILKLLMLTGASLSEIAGLAVSDVSLNPPIPFLHIRENGIRPLKTPSRERRVPLVDASGGSSSDAELTPWGASSNVAGVALEQATGRDQLFRGYSASRGADSVSARLNKALRTAGIPKSRRLTVHSLRHTMAEALRSAGVHYAMQRRLLGHAAMDVSDRYGSPTAELEEMRDALLKALPLLGRIEPSVYREDERIITA